MSAITKLIRVTASRNAAKDYGLLKFRALKTDIAALKEQLANDSISATAFFEAVIRGYNERHPAILAMVSDWLRTEKKVELKGSQTANLSKRDLDRLLDDIESAEPLTDKDDDVEV